jgi:hypothetical protein
MSQRHGHLAALIRREIGTEINSRFLRSLPAFRLDRDMPAHFSDLLARLDQAERESGEMRPNR